MTSNHATLTQFSESAFSQLQLPPRTPDAAVVKEIKAEIHQGQIIYFSQRFFFDSFADNIDCMKFHLEQNVETI